LRASPVGAEIVTSVGDAARFDAWCPVGSLPHLLRVSAPPPSPVHLAVPPEAAARGRRIAAPFLRAFRVGLCWTGNPDYPRNEMRSLSPAAFAPLAAMPDLRLFSLCKGAAVSALGATGMAEAILDASSDDADLADTAGLIAELDLVISSDTAVVHLAASLGKPVWTLLPHESFWQYGPSGRETAWYPTMRLFRQPRPGDWQSVIADVAEALGPELQARFGTA